MNITIETWLKRSRMKEIQLQLKETIEKELIPIKNLSRKDKKWVINKSRIKIYPMGSYIFKSGDCDAFIYYLLEGKVEMQAFQKKTVAVYGGTERAKQPISGNCPRKYSAKAASAAKVFRVDRELLASRIRQE